MKTEDPDPKLKDRDLRNKTLRENPCNLLAPRFAAVYLQEVLVNPLHPPLAPNQLRKWSLSLAGLPSLATFPPAHGLTVLQNRLLTSVFFDIPSATGLQGLPLRKSMVAFFDWSSQ